MRQYGRSARTAGAWCSCCGAALRSRRLPWLTPAGTTCSPPRTRRASLQGRWAPGVAVFAVLLCVTGAHGSPLWMVGLRQGSLNFAWRKSTQGKAMQGHANVCLGNCRFKRSFLAADVTNSCCVFPSVLV